jgi:hypothetical protein
MDHAPAATANRVSAPTAEKGSAVDEKKSIAGPVLIAIVTGLLTLGGTVAANVIQVFRETTLADKKFQADLVFKALEPVEQEKRVATLRFMIDANLIRDENIRAGLQQYLPPEIVPQNSAGAVKDVPQIPPMTASRELVVDGDRDRTDFSVFYCAAGGANARAETAAREIIARLQQTGNHGRITLQPWTRYTEVPLASLQGKTSVIVDGGHAEAGEVPRLREALGVAQNSNTLQVLNNAGTPTPWLLSIVACPT